MSIRRTKKYVAAVETAKSLGLIVYRSHSSAEEVYQEIESVYYWDSRAQAWLEHAQIDPKREMDKHLIRIRITAHMTYLNVYAQRIIDHLEEFHIQEVSKAYPNVRDSDGAGRIYITVRDIEE